MCGEHDVDGGSPIWLMGSSPHVRGALRQNTAHAHACGIIPACAGSTAFKSMSSPLRRDHPRMCGEHPIRLTMFQTQSGSSPHVRGALSVLCSSVLTAGIIPACAGSTMVTAAAHPRCRDHPRMCGEHQGQHVQHPRVSGSSPHVRGAR